MVDRSPKLLVAALYRPLNLLAPGAGLLLAASPWGDWWMFPLSLIPYALMVILSLRDPRFIERALEQDDSGRAGEAIEWKPVIAELSNMVLASPLQRIAASEQRLVDQLVGAPVSARSILMDTLGQVRTAARLAIELARKIKSLDATLATLQAMTPEQAKWEADQRRKRAEQSDDAQTKQAFLDAAKSLEESATSTESMVRLRERTVAQLENLAASLESLAVRSIRLRVSADDAGLADMGESLRVDVQAAQETLGVFEEQDGMHESMAASTPATAPKAAARAKGP